MSDKPENPPAFPHPYYEHMGDEPGMSLRDWFAGHALAGMASIEDSPRYETMASYAYQMADAMLAERAKR